MTPRIGLYSRAGRLPQQKDLEHRQVDTRRNEIQDILFDGERAHIDECAAGAHKEYQAIYQSAFDHCFIDIRPRAISRSSK